MIGLLIIVIVLLEYIALRTTSKNNTTTIESANVDQARDASSQLKDSIKNTSEQATQTYNLNGKLLTYPKNWKVVETKDGGGAGLNYNINFVPINGSKGVRLIVHSSYEATTCNNNYRDAEGNLIKCFGIPSGSNGVLLAEATDTESFKVYESLVNQLSQ